jgi:hypothetical protein
VVNIYDHWMDYAGRIMKTPPATPDFTRFTAAVSDILKVSKGEMQTRIEAHKGTGKRLSKGSSLAPAASSKVRSSFGKP